jgi:hypothetical protein
MHIKRSGPLTVLLLLGLLAGGVTLSRATDMTAAPPPPPPQSNTGEPDGSGSNLPPTHQTATTQAMQPGPTGTQTTTVTRGWDVMVRVLQVWLYRHWLP